ncbi:MAG: beta-N-acetylhexosaminidase [Acholeplasmataceae bacterium]|nr:beta-N-acetylhexosaminidase [Acholeplasmataceae bacterium]
MKIIGLELSKELTLIHDFTQYNFKGIDEVHVLQSDEQDYAIKYEAGRYTLSYRNLNHLFAGLGFIASHPKTDIKRTSMVKRLGYMIDCARNAVPKINTLKKQIINLALMGYTYMGLYLEDVFTIEDEPLFGYMRGRYKQEEIHDLVEHAKHFGIEVVPYIQTLAHLNAIFKHQKYASILDTNDILLVDEPKTYALIERMIVTVKAMFQTNQINIGMDEAWMLGLGNFLKKHGYQNRMDIMIRHLNQVLALCEKHQMKPQMWADMFFHLKEGQYFQKGTVSFADIEGLVPKNVELMYWDYYHTDPTDFLNKFDSIKTLTNTYGFAGGAWKWVGFAPHNAFSKRSMSAAIEAIKKVNLDHFVMTSWGDNGAEASLYSVLPSLYFVSNKLYNDNMDGENAFLTTFTGYNQEAWMALDLPNQITDETVVRTVNPSKYLLYEDPLLGDPKIMLHPSFQMRFQKIKEALKPYRQSQSPYRYLFDTLYRLVSVLTLKANLSIELYHAYHNKDELKLREISVQTLPSIIEELMKLYLTFKKQWYKENKSFGYEVQAYRMGGLIRRLEDINDTLRRYIVGKISVIEELEERTLALASDDDPTLGTIYYNQFSKYVTFGTF